MSETVHVTSVAMLESLGNAFQRFAHETQQPLYAVEQELRLAQEQIQKRIQHWQQVVQQYVDQCQRCQSALTTCLQSPGFQDSSGRVHPPNCSQQQQALNVAMGQLEEARRCLAQAKKSMEMVQQAYVGYQKASGTLKELVTAHTAKSVRTLQAHAQQLDRYLKQNTSLPGYPTLQVATSGEVYGSYSELSNYLTENDLTAKRGSALVGYEAHHIIADEFMALFGFSRAEGLAVAIHADEHMQDIHGATGIGFQLPRKITNEDGSEPVKYDIWEVIDGHMQAYQDIARPDLAAQVRDYAIEQKGRIIQAYGDGTVTWATPDDAAKAKRYLETLSSVEIELGEDV